MSLLIKQAREAAKKMSVLHVTMWVFVYFLVYVSPWLSQFELCILGQHQFFCKSSTSYICPLYSPLIVGLCSS